MFLLLKSNEIKFDVLIQCDFPYLSLSGQQEKLSFIDQQKHTDDSSHTHVYLDSCVMDPFPNSVNKNKKLWQLQSVMSSWVETNSDTKIHILAHSISVQLKPSINPVLSKLLDLFS